MGGKRAKFAAKVHLRELQSVTAGSGHFYAKVKAGGSSSTVGKTWRREVAEHRVIWNEDVALECKATIDGRGMLNPMPLAISVYKEEDGGRSADKVGKVVLNLSEYVGSAERECRFLLGSSKGTKGVQVHLPSPAASCSE